MKTKITTFVFTFVLMLLMAFSTNVLAQEIINENGDFSDADIGDNSGITNWALQGSDFATFEVVEDPDDAGNQVLRVEITDIGSVGDPWDIQPLHQNTELVAGESYTVSLRVKADNAGGGTPTISLDPGYNAQYGVDISGSTDWQTIEIDLFNATASASQQVGIHLGSENNADGDIFYLDDLEFVNADEPALWTFESGSYADWNLGDIGGTLDITDEFVMAGDSALHVTAVDSSLETNFQNDVFDNIAAGDTIKYNIYITSDDLALVNGFQAFWHAPEWDYHNEWLGTDGITAGEWSTIEFVMPEYDEPLNRFGLQMLLSEGNEAETPSLYIDDISVTPGVESEPGPIDPPSTESVVWNFDNPADIGSWVNGENSSQTFTGDEDAAEGDSSLHWTYTVDPSESWGGSADIELIMEDQVLTDLTDYDGMSLDYKVIEPVTPSDGGATFNMKIYVESGENGEELEQWHYTVPGVISDDSGEWQTAELLLEDFAIPSWETTHDGELYPDRIHKIEMQVIVGSDGSEVSGEFLIDNLVPYNAPLPVPEPPYAVGDIINYNGSFELSDLGESDPDAWTVSAADESNVEVIDDASDGDGRALSFEVSWTGNTNWYENEAVNEPINVVEGDTYQISFDLKADSEDRVAGVYLGMPESGGWERARGWDTPVLELNTEWTGYSFEHTATADNETHGMRVGVELNTEDNDGGTIYIDNIQVEKVGEVSREVDTQPLTYELNQNYPNPFNPSTTISYTIPEAADVKLDVFNILGQRVLTLIDEHQSAGVKQVNFDASNLASGVYLYRIQTDNFMQSRRMTLIK